MIAMQSREVNGAHPRSERSLSRRLLPLRGAFIGLVCALFAWSLGQLPLVRGVEDWLLDGLFTLRGQRATSTRILLVDIDDASLDELRKPALFLSPEFAETVRYLDQQGASAIGIDVLIPQSLSALPALQRGGDGDVTTMGTALEDSGKVVLPEWQSDGQIDRPVIQWQLKAQLNPDPGGTDFGLVNLTEDGDQFVRRQQLAIRTDDTTISYQFGLALLAKSRGKEIAWDDNRQLLTLGGDGIPLDAEQKMRINYVGPPGTIRPIPLAEVLHAARRKEPLPGAAEAIVIIGRAGPGAQDAHNTPYSNRYADYWHRTGGGLMSGPELQANIVATLHDRAFITTPWWLASLPWCLFLGAALGHAFLRLELGTGFALALVHHFGWKAAAVAAFIFGYWRVEMSSMLLLGALTYSVAFAFRWRVLRRVLRAVKSAPIAQALERDPDRLQRGGESRVVTVLFADIRGFTDFSERHSPAQVVELLNAYYQGVVPLIEREGGVIDKFIGDGLMVLFGAISERVDHAAAAVRAARAMVRCVETNQSAWAKLGCDGLRIGVGIHTGPVILGAVGTPTRLDFTAIGDTVNAAARIEGENKRFGSCILITNETCASVPLEERARLGIAEQAVITTVKGKQAPLHVHIVNEGRSAGNSSEP
jgi:adenylate cyclase